MISLKIKGKDLDLKFDFGAFFRANKQLSTNDTQEDGASQLWLQFVNEDPMAVYNALRVLVPAKYSDEDITDFLNDYADEKAFDDLTKQLEEELHTSAFFRRAAKQWLNLTSKYAVTGKAKNQAEEIQQQAVRDTLDALKKSLS
ncbi:tail assembly chaperone [Lactiplantibacillus modestisalitolerans]|uniref:Tail assembly chaperone n=1 Tax=Lactiplantibacillus modestisalitolerans TaxID=1457219 RepID=A0ABV5WVC9_9LACO|nr:tail assembly chaperone [Lactiplantibacillus modestisalitolerans]